MPKPAVQVSKIQKVNDDVFNLADDLLACEEPLEIRLSFNDQLHRIKKSISVTMRTPGNDFELAMGFLFTEGVINDMNDVASVKFCQQNKTENERENIVNVELKEDVKVDISKMSRNFYTTSSCGICGKTSIEAVQLICKKTHSDSEFKLDHHLIFGLPDVLRKQQNVFQYTGGLHAAALFDFDGKLKMLREDVGRHNALDKLIGAAMSLNILPLDNHILLLSGRSSFELVQKAAMAGIQVIAAIGAPSSLAVHLAKEMNITLIGFLRNDRFNIYSCNERINTVSTVIESENLI